jgi:hypothetical protein
MMLYKGKSKVKSQKAKVKSISGASPARFYSSSTTVPPGMRKLRHPATLLTFDFCLLTFDLPFNLPFDLH